MTADKFIKDSNINQLMYRSGDIVRLLPDGNIDYLYRKDKQVKIRGFRIELSEVEHALERIQGINKAVVIVQNHDRIGISLLIMKRCIHYHIIRLNHNYV